MSEETSDRTVAGHKAATRLRQILGKICDSLVTADPNRLTTPAGQLSSTSIARPM